MLAELHKEVRRIRRLESAWKKVRDNGRKSRSKRTRAEIDEFSGDAGPNIRSIQSQMVAGSFVFAPGRGWAEPPKSAGKAPRPIVITPIRSRVVARAILDVLLEQPNIQDVIQQPYSFGGIQKVDPEAIGAVPGAVQAAVQSIQGGNCYFIRSDISGFFRKIPKNNVLEFIRSRIDCPQFCDLVEASMKVELDNIDQLREHADIFPLEDIGVAQGCALSPLAGNILLSEFDQRMNSGVCTCIRYIDDFLILGPTQKDVEEGFKLAIELLSKFDMEAYSPKDRPDKAECGNVYLDCLEFLGVEIVNGSVRPSGKNRGNLINSVNDIIQDHTKKTPSGERSDRWNYDHSYLRCLATINSVVAGWGNQYYFCNDRKIMDDLDIKIGNQLTDLAGRFRSMSQNLTPLGRRRLMGVRSLHDCKVDPIEWRRGRKGVDTDLPWQ